VGPLTGIRIVEMALAVQGPGAGGYLAEMGADVIKVEPPWGDSNRTFRGVGNALPAEAVGTQFIGVSAGKRSIALDVHAPLGKGVINRLIDGADVFLSNYRQSGLERMGMGYDALSARNSRLVYAIANGYGHKGDDADKRMSDPFALSRSGIASVTGEPGSRALLPGAIIGDTAGAIQLAMGVVLALFARERTGGGQEVSTSAYGALLWMQAWEINHVSLTGLVPQKDGSHHWNNPALNGIYETRDGREYCLSVSPDPGWADFCHFGGIAEVLADERWDTAAKRSGLGNAEDHARVRPLRGHVARAFKARTSAEWDEFFAVHPELIAQKVLTYPEVLDDPQAIENGYIVEKDIPFVGKRKVVGPPIQLSETPAVPQPLFAQMGEHTGAVMSELGYSPAQISALEEETKAALARRLR
jgi:crotonobetainyl-CoA:carnitine CoA-transferase CaiB-like acyl-CoA transferase